MIADWIGPPQVAALLVLAQRGAEELWSRRNTARLLAGGGREEGAAFYPVVAATQLVWLAAVGLAIPPAAQPVWSLVWLYIALQGLRLWIILSLGRFWTHRIVTLDGAPLVATGPYRLLRHPNYVLVAAEVFLLPAAFGAWVLGVAFVTLQAAVLIYKARLEDAALRPRMERTG